MKQYAEQICSNDISVHNIFPILGIHATPKKRCSEIKWIEHVSLKYAIIKKDTIK